MEAYNDDDSAVNALAFLEFAEANVSPLGDAAAWEATLDHLHDDARRDAETTVDTLLGETTLSA